MNPQPNTMYARDGAGNSYVWGSSNGIPQWIRIADAAGNPIPLSGLSYQALTTGSWMQQYPGARIWPVNDGTTYAVLGGSAQPIPGSPPQSALVPQSMAGSPSSYQSQYQGGYGAPQSQSGGLSPAIVAMLSQQQQAAVLAQVVAQFAGTTEPTTYADLQLPTTVMLGGVSAYLSAQSTSSPSLYTVLLSSSQLSALVQAWETAAGAVDAAATNAAIGAAAQAAFSAFGQALSQSVSTALLSGVVAGQPLGTTQLVVMMMQQSALTAYTSALAAQATALTAPATSPALLSAMQAVLSALQSYVSTSSTFALISAIQS